MLIAWGIKFLIFFQTMQTSKFFRCFKKWKRGRRRKRIRAYKAVLCLKHAMEKHAISRFKTLTKSWGQYFSGIMFLGVPTLTTLTINAITTYVNVNNFSCGDLEPSESYRRFF